ncbi:hypothetical protein T492DRAFT_1014182 [Pavlovales sp. CCMP2436]|nr:hypothetical protein T492DRAFT_1014182 [Pavlovales sp. CCMP2436]
MHPPAAFVYGSLMWEPVLRAMLGRVPKATSACIEAGFKRCRVRNEPYPGLVRTSEPVKATHGLLLTDLVGAERAIFDLFEDVEGEVYTARAVEARIVVGVMSPYGWATSTAHREVSALALGETVQASLYLFGDSSALLPELWAPDDFASHLPTFLAMVERFALEPAVAKLRLAAQDELSKL